MILAYISSFLLAGLHTFLSDVLLESLNVKTIPAGLAIGAIVYCGFMFVPEESCDEASQHS